MKTLFIFTSIFLSVVSHGQTVTRYSCNGGRTLLGSLLQINVGSFLSSGHVSYQNPLPSEFEWTGSEPRVETEQVKQDLSAFGELSSIQGAEYLKGKSRQFQVLKSTTEDPGGFGSQQSLYVETELLDGTRNSGVMVFTIVSHSGTVEAKNAEIATCQRLITTN